MKKMNNLSLITKDLTFSYNRSVTFGFPDITCGSGNHCIIVGPSGCGKTTFLHLIAGLLKPDSGEVIIQGTDTVGLHSGDADRFRGKNIGIIYQKPHFIQWLTAFENLQIAQYLNNLPTENENINHLLRSLNLQDKTKSKPSQMSQGELQRLSIARAVINKPGLILADEPTSSLDDKNCEEALNLLKRQAEELQASLVIATHDKRLLDHFPDRIFL
jgi:putative ABC transport system ATP-binding protein